MTKSFVLRHSGSQPMSSQTCNVGMPVFWRWGLVSVKSYPLLGVEPEEVSQEALGEDAILHRSSGRPGEDKKKVEKMLGELPDAIDDLDGMDDVDMLRLFSWSLQNDHFLQEGHVPGFIHDVWGRQGERQRINKWFKLTTTRRNIPFNQEKKHTLQLGVNTLSNSHPRKECLGSHPCFPVPTSHRKAAPERCTSSMSPASGPPSSRRRESQETKAVTLAKHSCLEVWRPRGSVYFLLLELLRFMYKVCKSRINFSKSASPIEDVLIFLYMCHVYLCRCIHISVIVHNWHRHQIDMIYYISYWYFEGISSFELMKVLIAVDSYEYN